MSPLIHRKASEPCRKGLSTEELWKSADSGLIAAWEVGRNLAKSDSALAERARRGELPILGWKGGVATTLKSGRKYGTLRYLAMWQGLRDDDLSIDPALETELTCTKTGVSVTYTADFSKYAIV